MQIVILQDWIKIKKKIIKFVISYAIEMAGTPLRRVHAKWHEVNIVVTQNKIVHKSQTSIHFVRVTNLLKY